jgi:hypothetical protein
VVKFAIFFFCESTLMKQVSPGENGVVANTEKTLNRGVRVCS